MSGTVLGIGDIAVMIHISVNKINKNPFLHSRGNGTYYVADTILGTLHIVTASQQP